MSPNSDGYNEAVNLTKLLQQHYEKLRTEMAAVAEMTAREEVQRIAASNERELQRLIGEAVARQRGGLMSGLQLIPVLKVIAAVVVLWLGYLGTAKLFPGLIGRSGDTEAAVDGSDGPGGVEGVDTILPVIERVPLHQVAAARYDSLFARRDAVFQKLIERVGTRERAVLDTAVAQALARWTADPATATDADRDRVRGAAFQAALHELTQGEYASPIDGRVDRERCAGDPACQRLVARWRADRTVGMRLLPPIPDGRAPDEEELMAVEKVVIYSRLEP